MNKILITGGAGFIGSHLVDRLLKEDWQIIIIDDFNDFYNPELKRENIKQALNNKNCIVEEGDITDKDFVTQVFEKHIPSYIIHLAARAGVRPSLENPELYTRVNLIGTVNILEAAKELKIDNFVFGSSSSVYGDNEKIPFSEDDEIENQISPYAVTKRGGELLCRMYAELYSIPTTCLRFFTVYGPRQRPDLAIRKFMTNILQNKPIDMYGDGSSSRDYTYIDDIVEGIYKSINNPHPFEIINLGNSSPVRLSELISNIEDALNKRAEINQLPMQRGDVKRTFADISRAKQLLDWEPKTDIRIGLKIMADWMKKNI